jgi:hypothetical protein
MWAVIDYTVARFSARKAIHSWQACCNSWEWPGIHILSAPGQQAQSEARCRVKTEVAIETWRHDLVSARVAPSINLYPLVYKAGC